LPAGKKKRFHYYGTIHTPSVALSFHGTHHNPPQRHDHPPQPLSSQAHRHCQVSLFFIFFTLR
jgi:hypothetical protein